MEPAKDHDKEPAPAPPVQRRADDALASSVPDDNHLLMQMIRLVLDRKGFLASLLSGLIMLVWVMAKWGVPAILAASQLILQLHGDNLKERVADRQTAQDQLQATQGLAAGVDRLGGKIDAQGTKLNQLAGDVDAIKQHQAAADARLGRLSAEQAAQARRLAHGPTSQPAPMEGAQ